MHAPCALAFTLSVAGKPQPMSTLTILIQTIRTS